MHPASLSPPHPLKSNGLSMHQHWPIWCSVMLLGGTADAREIFSAPSSSRERASTRRMSRCVSVIRPLGGHAATWMLSRENVIILVSLSIAGLTEVCALRATTQLQSTATSSTAQLDTPDRVTAPLHNIYLLGGRSTARVCGVPPSHRIDC
jgi:hypothetical protein